MQQSPEHLQQMLSILMNCIIFEDCKNQWSMSRPLLGLILLNKKYFDELRSNLISNQGPEQQKALNACFEKLMEGVEQSLLIKNRDRFMQNVSVFKHEVTETLRISAATSNPGNCEHDELMLNIDGRRLIRRVAVPETMSIMPVYL